MQRGWIVEPTFFVSNITSKFWEYAFLLFVESEAGATSVKNSKKESKAWRSIV